MFHPFRRQFLTLAAVVASGNVSFVVVVAVFPVVVVAVFPVVVADALGVELVVVAADAEDDALSVGSASAFFEKGFELFLGGCCCCCLCCCCLPMKGTGN